MTIEEWDKHQTFDYEGDLCIWDLEKGPPPEGVDIADLVTHRIEAKWDVSAALEIVKGRMQMVMIFPAEIATIGKNVKVDHDYAMTTDLTIPVIAVVIQLDEMRDMFIIDGWHRIHKAVQLGIENIPCYVLSEEQTKTVTLSWKVTPL